MGIGSPSLSPASSSGMGDGGSTVKLLLLRGGSDEVFFAAQPEVSLFLSICGRMGTFLFWVFFLGGDDCGLGYQPALFDEVNDGGAGVLLPLPLPEQHRRSSFSIFNMSSWVDGVGSCGIFFYPLLQTLFSSAGISGP